MPGWRKEGWPAKNERQSINGESEDRKKSLNEVFCSSRRQWARSEWDPLDRLVAKSSELFFCQIECKKKKKSGRGKDSKSFWKHGWRLGGGVRGEN